ncbi:MAG: hypothetical protein COZ18_02440 [Flexibacter sp. CG_4_10_14_3_um_filter_32_15]|nr:MAG: hypothetical protein COZ18_02440 [Flexibacter sp. CG_4_10_14_3_um_filter_32_15]
MAKIAKELKEAICQMPQKEKDKILLRLIAKDQMLIARLEHELFGDEAETKALAEEIKEDIDKTMNYDHDTPGWLMMAMRSINGAITRHVKITKDKIGEIELTLYLLSTTFKEQGDFLEEYSYRADKFAAYVCKRTDFVLKKIIKLHPDLQFDYKNEVEFVLDFLHTSEAILHDAETQNIPTDWENFLEKYGK